VSNFIARNKPVWSELEQLVDLARKSDGRITPEQICRLDVLYRRTAVHLAQATTRTNDTALIQYLNGLTAAAHSVIYLPPKQPMLSGAARFATQGFARTVARTWHYHVVSTTLLFGGALVAYFASRHDLAAAYALLPAGDIRLPGSTREQLEDVLRSGRDTNDGGKFLFMSFLFANNLKVGMLAMALGVLAAVPTVLLLIYNGMILGSFVATHHQAGIDIELWAWILPHGITEIGAIILAGGIGLMLGHAVINPGLLDRQESLRRAGVEAGRMCLGVAAMLVFAAIIESYLRQSHLTTSSRLAFAAGTAVFWALYFGQGFLSARANVAGGLTTERSAAASPRIG
jgi:uncharacterized membrane protein SpoIIM required for sporulation